MNKPVTPGQKDRHNSPVAGYSPSSGGAPPVETYYLLKEDGDALLKEDGDNILKEDAI